MTGFGHNLLGFGGGALPPPYTGKLLLVAGGVVVELPLVEVVEEEKFFLQLHLVFNPANHIL